MRHFAADRRCDVSAEKGTVKMVAYSDFSCSIYLVQRANLVLSKGPYLNDVYTGRGEGVYPNADVEREVA